MAQAQMRLEMLANHYNPSGLGFGSCSSFKPLFVMAMREGGRRAIRLFSQMVHCNWSIFMLVRLPGKPVLRMHRTNFLSFVLLFQADMHFLMRLPFPTK
jgi:hypothetical protein